MWIDTHAHLAEEAFDHDRAHMIQRAKDAQIEKILLIGANLDGAIRALELAKTDDIFDVAIGFHPQDILDIQIGEWEAMLALLKDERVVAVGEIGLDYYWQKDVEVQAQQRELLIRQLNLADTLNKPVIIHCRDAMQDCYDILKAHRPKNAVIMHCFSGSLAMAQRFVELGFYISLAGPLTFKNARVPKEVALGIDLKHLMIETDSPYLAPDPHRGKRNESAYVSLVGHYLAQLKGLSNEELAKALTQNYQDFLQKKEV
jgi:TatD DNase family protein